MLEPYSAVRGIVRLKSNSRSVPSRLFRNVTGAYIIFVALLIALPLQVARADSVCKHRLDEIVDPRGVHIAWDLVFLGCARQYEGGERQTQRRTEQRSQPNGGGELAGNPGDLNTDGFQASAIAGPRCGNPVLLATGNKIEPEKDFATDGEMALFLERTYNQLSRDLTLFGFNWTSNFDYRLGFGGSSSYAACYARPGIPECTNAAAFSDAWAHRPDGRSIRFTKAADGTYYEAKASPISRLVPQSDGTWLLVFEDNLKELYSKGGYPLWIENEHGIRWTFEYGGLNGTQLQRVTHTSGRFVTFSWTGGELREIRDPAGNPYVFTYTFQTVYPGIHTLKTTTLPGLPATTVTYHYTGEEGEPTNGFRALTGKSFNGARYSRFTYDSAGRGATTEHANGVEHHSFEFTEGPLNTLTVAHTGPLTRTTTYEFAEGRLLSAHGNETANCPDVSSSRTYDTNGNLDVAVDNKNVATNYDYDSAGRLSRKVEAESTPQARISTYEWDAAKNRLTSLTVSNASGVAQLRTDYAYTTDDRIASIAETNLSPNVPANKNQVRTTTYAYSKHSNGMIRSESITGYRPGDAVTRTYDAFGNLIQETSPTGTTTYSDHTALGRPRRIVGPNGAITEFVYDARDRVTSSSQIVSGQPQTSVISYDAFGRIKSILTPDGRTIVKEYDDAWRLTRQYEATGDGLYDVTRFAYNNASLVTSVISERTSAVHKPQQVPVLTVPDKGPNGTFRASWSAVEGAEYYVLEESLTSNNDWTAVHSANVLVKDFANHPAGTYYYRVLPCNQAGCGAPSWSHLVSIVYKPGAAPILSAPTQSTSGTYTISWNAVANATHYQLEENSNGSWTLIHNDVDLSKLIVGKNAGTHQYRGRACNSAGCGPDSTPIAVIEVDPPGAPPNLFGPGVNTNGSFTLTWTAVGGATYYQLDELPSGGGWTNILSNNSTALWLARPTSQAFSYRVRACNDAGCGVNSTVITAQTPVYSAQFLWQSIPALMYMGDAAVVTVQMVNTGNTTWTAGEAYNLGSQTSTDNTRWGTNRVAVAGTVYPGQTATFTFAITAPSNVGEGLKVFQWRMVRDGVTWFGDQSPLSYISVASAGGGGEDPPPNPCGNRPNCHEN